MIIILFLIKGFWCDAPPNLPNEPESESIPPDRITLTANYNDGDELNGFELTEHGIRLLHSTNDENSRVYDFSKIELLIDGIPKSECRLILGQNDQIYFEYKHTDDFFVRYFLENQKFFRLKQIAALTQPIQFKKPKNFVIWKIFENFKFQFDFETNGTGLSLFNILQEGSYILQSDISKSPNQYLDLIINGDKKIKIKLNNRDENNLNFEYIK